MLDSSITEDLSKSDLEDFLKEMLLEDSSTAAPRNSLEKPTQSESFSSKSDIVQESPKNDTLLLIDNNTDNDLPLTSEGWQVLDFQSPAELLCFFNPQLNNGEVTLHKWQVEDLELFASISCNSQHPFKYALCAANGSGKDCFIIAGCLMWLCVCKRRSLSVVTSASGVQLTGQTENYLRTLGNQINLFYQKLYGCDILKINQRFIKCKLSGSEIRLFATDEEGKSEGWHPLEPNCEFLIVINEAKSVPEAIFNGLKRCTGFTRMMVISTPGEPHGSFYKYFNTWPHKRRVTFYDCPHLSKEEFESDKIELGENSFLFRSKWLALFTTIGGSVVISQEALDKCLAQKNNIKWIGKEWPIRIGIDLSLGGDETVLTFCRGNRVIKTVVFRLTDGTLVADRINLELKQMEIKKDHAYISMDDGGNGRPIIDILQRMGYVNIRRVLNQSKSRSRNGQFRNRGCELYFKFARLVQERLIILPDDKKLHDQLTSRHYKQAEALGTLTLLSKAEEKADGLDSPDRADSLVLAYSDLSINDFFDAIEKDKEVKRKGKYLGKDEDEIQENYEEYSYEDEMRKQKQKPINGSLQILLKNNLKYREGQKYYGKYPIITDD